MACNSILVLASTAKAGTTIKVRNSNFKIGKFPNETADKTKINTKKMAARPIKNLKATKLKDQQGYDENNGANLTTKPKISN